jgi:hypothetical protein
VTATATQPAWRIARADVVTDAPPRSARTNHGRRARTAVLAGVLLFVVAQVASHRVIDSEAVPLRDPIYAEKIGLLKRHPEFFSPTAARARLLAVGSSRTQLCLDAERLSDDRTSAFNFGCAGCGPVANALYQRRLLDDGVTFDAALIELHPAMLADPLSVAEVCAPGPAPQRPATVPFEARWLHDYRLRRHEVDTLRGFGWPIDTPSQFRPAGPLQTAHTFRYAVLNAYAPSLLPCPFGLGLLDRTDARGHVPGIEITPEKRAEYLAQAYAEYFAAFADYRPGGPAVAAVRDMLTQLQARGIRATLLLTPESSEFRSWYGPGKRAVISAFAVELAHEFGAPLIDAREWLPDAEFADGHHVTPDGTRTFTDRLRGALK